MDMVWTGEYAVRCHIGVLLGEELRNLYHNQTEYLTMSPEEYVRKVTTPRDLWSEFSDLTTAIRVEDDPEIFIARYRALNRYVIENDILFEGYARELSRFIELVEEHDGNSDRVDTLIEECGPHADSVRSYKESRNW